MYALTIYVPKEPWNKNKLIGQKLPLKLQQIWSIRIRLELSNKRRDLALFNLAIQQVAWLRSRRVAGQRCLSRQYYPISSNCCSEENTTTRSV